MRNIKLIAVVCLTACFQPAVTVHAQTVTLNVRKARLETVFEEIRKQTGYNYLLRDDLLARTHAISITLVNVPLTTALDSCFAGQPVTYAITGTTISIVKKLQDPARTDPVLRTITGKVNAADGSPLTGASVRVKGTIRGVNTDANGEFVLKELDDNAAIEVSHVGYISQSIVVRQERQLSVWLKPESRSLDEVIATGYRTSTKKLLLSTVSEVTAKDIMNQPVNDVLAALQGRVPGMMITQYSGLPGSTFVVQIRGQRSIGSSPGKLPLNSPLYIVDGVPFLTSSESVSQIVGVTTSTPFSTINPEDIESITILKDAGSTSIYGSMGANGVVLITTRKPKAGKTSIDVNMYMGEGRITRQADYMNTQQYIAMRREALANDGVTAQAINPALPGYAPDILLWDTMRYTDWKKVLIGGPANVSNVHTRLSGGSLHTQFSLSTSYNRESTVFPGDFHKSLSTVILNVAHSSLNNRFRMMVSSSYSSDRNHLLARDLTNSINTAPNAPVYDSTGQLSFREKGIPYFNPLAFTKQTYDLFMERIAGNLTINYCILPFLNFKTTAGYTILNGDETRKIPIASQDPANSPTGVANFGNSKNRIWIAEPQLEFTSAAVRQYKFKALLGTSFREQIAKGTVLNGDGYVNDASLGSISGADSVTATNDYRQYRLASTYGMINFNSHDKYIAEFTGRVDVSSRFGPGKRVGRFGSVAAGWIFSNEGFIRQHVPWLSFGKIRASYGTSGNDQIGDYAYLDTWTNTLNPYQSPGLQPSRLYNRDLQWEQERNLDIGLNLGFLHNRLLLDLTWNQSRTGNQLVGTTLPTQTGFSSIIRNVDALVQNRNLELELNAKLVDKPLFKWSLYFNISFQRNKLLRFPGLDSSAYKFNYKIGEPLTLLWRYHTSGINPVTGIYQLLDHTGAVTQFPNQNTDLFPVGKSSPDYFGGFQNSIQYHSWQLDFLFQFVKQTGQHYLYARSLAPGYSFTNLPVDLMDRWRKAGDKAAYQKYTQDPSSDAFIAAYFHASSEASITNASFIRLKNISLSYSLEAKWMEQMEVEGCSIYVQAQNLLTITPYRGADPENATINPQGLPPLRMIVVGIRVSFK